MERSLPAWPYESAHSPSTLSTAQLRKLEHLNSSDCDKKKVNQYKCTECGKMYNDTTVLQRHSLIHTGERPFPCNKCDKRFRQKSNLEGHRGVHTSETTKGK